jgi:hypothetical protein
MKPQELQRTAYTVECFLNALRLDDCAVRTELEEALVRWLADDKRHKADHLIYRQGSIFCYNNGSVSKSYSVPLARQIQTLWCNAAKLSVIDGSAFAANGQLQMLGMAGLLLTMPGSNTAASTKQQQRNSNNNNNNNNG